MQQTNLYRVEAEELKRQIDVADANARVKEDEVRLLEREHEQKMRLLEERTTFRSSREESRAVNELKSELRMTKHSLETQVREKEEELDY